jgi:hypothetical protein
MRSYLTHDLRNDRELVFAQQAATSLAIVDLESYPTFVAPQADYLDLLQHLCGQFDALTAAMWEVPDALLRISLTLAFDQRPAARLTDDGHRFISSGWVRTDGRLALVTQDRLLDCARHRKHDLLHGPRTAPETEQSHLLLVPPGVYGVTVFSGSPHHGRYDGERRAEAVHYAVVLRHSPHPAPRVAPVRLRNFFATARQDLDNVIGMRKMPDYSPST